MNSVIIKACLNGARGREECPAVPWTPEEIAEEARRAAEAGASIVHIHARTAEGRNDFAADTYSRIARLVRERCDVLINFTTARDRDRPIETIESMLRETVPAPDMVSVNMGFIVGHSYRPDTGEAFTRIVPNSLDDMLRIFRACEARGILPEPAILDVGMFAQAGAMIRNGLLQRYPWFLLEFGSLPGPGEGYGQRMPGTVHDLAYLVGRVESQFPGALWCAHGAGVNTFPVCAAAMAMGGHVRVGMEDGVRLADGRVVRSNAEMVAWAAMVARALGREPATPAQARQALGLAPAAA